MRGSWRIARIVGIDINIHWSFSFIILWMIWQGAFGHRELRNVIFISAAMLLLFGCVALHELGHALVALRLNVAVKNIIILPIGGLAQVESLPEKPLHDLLITAAGPLVNLVVAIGAILTLFVLGEIRFLIGFMASPETVIGTILQSSFQQDALTGLIIFLLLTNGVLFVFNLIPAFPMDGGRIVRAVLAMFLSYARATQMTRAVGLSIALFLLFWAFYWRSVGLLFMASFVFVAGISLPQIRHPR